MTDIEIQKEYKKEKIINIAKKFGLKKSNLQTFGDYKAKLTSNIKRNQNGNLILVTATNPTKFGEGKTTVSIGLSDALNSLGKKAVLALREPSLGPVFGIKGGACGGGYAQIVPMEDINLHFNGDFHAITSANNLLSALIDNHIYFGNELNLNPERINFHRCLDINDRALRNIELNVEGRYKRKETFNITAASEMMSIATLSQDIKNLKRRIGNICIGFNYKNKPVYAKQLKCEDSIAVLLKDALKPNLVQTLEGNLALVHLGPFANISHGCNSVIATKNALKIGDYCVTEAGFGADLGAQKFLDFICREGEFAPNVVVVVTTIRSLKFNGGVEEKDISKSNINAVRNGVNILVKHYKNLTNSYNLNVVVAINKFTTDTDEELEELKCLLKEQGIQSTVCEPYSKGGKGCVELAHLVVNNSKNQDLKFSYNMEDSVMVKLEKIVKNIYGANNLFLTDEAKEKLQIIKTAGFDSLPVIIAKTQYSLTDDAKKIGVTKDFDFTITDFEIHSGAGYIVAIAGKMLLMPGLNKCPNALNIKINNKENIDGLF